MKYLVCLDDPMPADGSCTTQGWTDVPSLLPSLSVADASAIATQFLLALAAVMAVKVALRKSQ